MERFTYKGRTYGYTSRRTFKEICARLAAYEELGLAPDEMRAFLNDTTGSLHEKLEQWITAESEGRLLIQPCKVADILYYYPAWYARNGYNPTPISVEEVNSYNGNVVVECYMDLDTRLSLLPADFGKTVFFNRKEALASQKGSAE